MTPPRNVGQSTARGVAMLASATVAGKFAGLIGTLILAKLLAPEDFGLVSLALGVMAFGRAIEQLGLREILIREQERFDRWVNSALWLAAGIGLVGMAITMLSAPIVAAAYGKPELMLLILVIAPASPLISISQICEARLERDMRYRSVTAIHIGVVVVQWILAVLFALVGLGALSFVLPRPLISIGRLIYVWRLVRPRMKRDPQRHRIASLVGRGWPTTIAAVLDAGTQNADYFILAGIASEKVLGFYYFAFSQSSQIVQVFAASLTRVMVPGLSTMRDDPGKQARAYLKGMRLIGLLISPLCIAQAALCGPVLRIIFQEKWIGAIAPLQVLSVSIIFSMITWPIVSLLMAQGRYTLRLVLSATALICFVTCVSVGAIIGKQYDQAALGAALGVLALRVLYGPVQTWYVCRVGGVSFGQILIVYLRPLTNAAVTVGPVWLLAESVAPYVEGGYRGVQYADIARCLIIGLLGPPVFVMWMRFTQHETWSDLVERSLGAVPAKVGRLVPSWLR